MKLKKIHSIISSDCCLSRLTPIIFSLYFSLVFISFPLVLFWKNGSRFFPLWCCRVDFYNTICFCYLKRRKIKNLSRKKKRKKEGKPDLCFTSEQHSSVLCVFFVTPPLHNNMSWDEFCSQSLSFVFWHIDQKIVMAYGENDAQNTWPFF